MYITLKKVMLSEGYEVLADGTNLDDLQEERPGLRAINELGVMTPLVDAGLTKLKIRALTKRKELSNFDLPSNSCLATRIQWFTKIENKLLQEIGNVERFLKDLGFYGCRVRTRDNCTLVEIEEKDLPAFAHASNRVRVDRYFKQLGLGPIVLKKR